MINDGCDWIATLTDTAGKRYRCEGGMGALDRSLSKNIREILSQETLTRHSFLVASKLALFNREDND